MLHKVRQRHHQVVEHIRSARNQFNASGCDALLRVVHLVVLTEGKGAIPDVDARNNLLVNESLLQLVRLLVALLNGELLDLGQLARERLVLTTPLSEINKRLNYEFVFQKRNLDCCAA